MPAAEVRAFSTSDAMKPEQKVGKPENEGHDSVDNITSQEIGRDPFLSFSRTGESSVQWIQLLHALDQQGNSKFSNGTKVDNYIGGKDRELDLFNNASSFPPEMNVVKESVHSLKSSGLPLKGTKSTSQQIQTLNIPEAVVAFVQAAAKANGEPEKYIPGWPLFSPSKVQLQKCDKCSREFCSTINYRRHKRVHRRSLNIVKDSLKNRGLLSAFWDKLSLDDAKEILSLKNAAIEEVTSSSVIRALTSLIRKPGLFSLPEIYAKAGMTILDLIQARPSRLPISSQDLFNVLDDASEKTFLCAGTALSMQKFVFDGETEKIALELKNLIACVSFMLEQKLVKAWLADKDIEALRCQKLLVEEEEASQKRQAKLLERKRLKKLRQKEQKEKESTEVNTPEFNTCSPQTVEGTSGSPGIRSPRSPSESDLNMTEASLNDEPIFLKATRILDHDAEANSREHMHSEDADQNADHHLQIGRRQQGAINSRLHLHAEDLVENVDPQLQMVSGQWQAIAGCWPSPNPARSARNGSQLGQVPAVKGSVLMKHGSYRDPKAAKLANGLKIWTRKSKPDIEEGGANDRDRVDREYREQEHKEQLDLSDRCEVMIGSINVRLGDDNDHGNIISLRRNNFQQKLAKSDSGLNGANRLAVKLWRPVGRHQTEDSATISSDKRDTCTEDADCDPSDGSHLASVVMDDNCSESCCNDSSMVLGGAGFSGPSMFSSHVAEAFLAQRWKEAITADHVMLALSAETKTSDSLHTPEGNLGEASLQLSDCCGQSAESWATGASSFELATASKPKFAKPEKSYSVKYVPKQRNNG